MRFKINVPFITALLLAMIYVRIENYLIVALFKIEFNIFNFQFYLQLNDATHSVQFHQCPSFDPSNSKVSAVAIFKCHAYNFISQWELRGLKIIENVQKAIITSGASQVHRMVTNGMNLKAIAAAISPIYDQTVKLLGYQRSGVSIVE